MNIFHLKKCFIVVREEQAAGLVIILSFLQVSTDRILKYISQAIQIYKHKTKTPKPCKIQQALAR